MATFLVGFIALALVVVAFQVSCFFAYEESKKEKVQVAAEPCLAEQ